MTAAAGPITAIPYGIIADALRAGDVVPFLGAGASGSLRPDGQSWASGAAFLPFGSELAAHLSDVAGYPDEKGREDLPLVASYYAHVASDRDMLNKKLRAIFRPGCPPGPIHKLLAEAQTVAPPARLLVLTTNYDELIEGALVDPVVVVDRGRYPKLYVKLPGGAFEVIHDNELRGALDTCPGAPVVLKLHGGVGTAGNDHYVITEQDYVDFLGRSKKSYLPSAINTLLVGKRFLFVGYGLEDWNVRVLLHKLPGLRPRGEDGNRRSWAIRRSVSRSEQAIWQDAHRVNIYTAELDEFVAGLRKALFP